VPTCSDFPCIFWLSVLHAAHKLSNPWQRPAKSDNRALRGQGGNGVVQKEFLLGLRKSLNRRTRATGK
jgi:hypothetical protein